MNKQLKLADWARMYFDIDEVKKRVLLGHKPAKWRDLTEEEKLKKCEPVIAEVTRFSQGNFGTWACPHLKVNWHEITDLEAYGIVRPPKTEQNRSS